MWQVCGAEEVRAEFWWKDLMERHYLNDIGVDGRIKLEWIFK